MLLGRFLGSLVAVALATAVFGCTPGGGGASRSDAPDGGTPSAPVTPQTIEVDGDPNGLFWSAGDNVLYVADDAGNRILSFDGSAFQVVATLPGASSSGPGLGQLLRRSDGSIVVPRFGYGTAGDVVVVDPDGKARALKKLDKQRRRIGLTEGKDGRLFVGYFAGEKPSRVGAVAVLDIDAETESDIATDFKKPVGVLADADGLLVADQDASEIFRVPFDSPEKRSVVARIEAPDLMTWGEDGSFYVGSKAGVINHVRADGTVERVGDSLREVRGIAVDTALKRIFAVDHDTKATSARHYLQILPLAE